MKKIRKLFFISMITNMALFVIMTVYYLINCTTLINILPFTCIDGTFIDDDMIHMPIKADGRVSYAIDTAVRKEMDILPKSLIEDFYNHGYSLTISNYELEGNDYFDEMLQNGEASLVAGSFNALDKQITIHATLSSARSSCIHEFGHYVDSKYKISETEEFRRVWLKEKAYFDNDAYHRDDQKEFFAECFQDYYKSPDKLKEECPETYEIIDNLK